MVFRAAFILLPMAAAFAQTPPPEVDKALRERVSEFFQYHVDGEFQKAFDLVAEDTKKYYFAAQKRQFKSFKIDEIKYTEDFSKALVALTCQEMMRVRAEFPETMVTVPMTTNWKLENGKWAWYRDTTTEWLTPMGPSSPQGPKKDDPQNPKQKVDLSPEALADRAKRILQQSGLDKNEIKLSATKASSDQVVFHNGQPGSIELTLATSQLPPGLTAKLDKKQLNGGDDATIKVTYDPPAGAAPPPVFNLQLYMAPFNRSFMIQVRFDAAN